MAINFEAYGWSPVTGEDRKELRLLLGREPHPIIAVARRSKDGRPQIIVNDPLPYDNQGRLFPFPTLFWLVSSVLVRAVDRLESEGWIDRLRKSMIGDPDRGDDHQDETRLSDQFHLMMGAHRESARLRLQLVDTSLLNKLQKEHPGQYEVLANTGVAGLRHADGVKCLHAHLADYLGRPNASPNTVNPIGRRVAQLLLKRGEDLNA